MTGLILTDLGSFLIISKYYEWFASDIKNQHGHSSHPLLQGVIPCMLGNFAG
jgi:hypothetical protein